jgi:hypothetical protein
MLKHIIKSIDTSHIIDKLRTIPKDMIIEIIIILFLLNLLFAFAYYKTYLNNKSSFKNTHNTKPLTLFDFFYFSCTTFFSLGYDIIPQSILSRTICIIQLVASFLITTIYIAKIINN